MSKFFKKIDQNKKRITKQRIGAAVDEKLGWCKQRPTISTQRGYKIVVKRFDWRAETCGDLEVHE